MNIFVTNTCPIKSAIILDDKRLIKMVLETTQLLSTTLSILGSEKAPYKPTHKNHPCSVWVRESLDNFLWCVEYGLALCDEYTLQPQSLAFVKLQHFHLKHVVVVCCQQIQFGFGKVGLGSNQFKRA